MVTATLDRPSTSRLPRLPALVAGLALVAMAVVAALANFVVLEGLVTPGDAATTATDIAGSEGVFRLGIAGFVIVALLDLLVAWALYELFRPIQAGVALVAGWLRAAYVPVLVVATGELTGALGASTDADVLESVEAFQRIWDLGIILFAVHLALVAWLTWRVGGRTPRAIGVLAGIAAVGYLVDAFGSVLVAGYSLELALFTFVGELAFIVWLLVVGFRRPTRA